MYPIFLQINISNDPNKYGLVVTEVADLVNHCKKLFHVELLGLMAITANQSLDKTGGDFKQPKQLQQFYHLKHLSMGMSDDWKIAVDFGATIIRIGQLFFT